MRPSGSGQESRHPYEPAGRFDGGDLDCGSGLLLRIRRHIDPLETGQLLELLSTEPSVAEDLPAWCRMTGNELVSTWHDETRTRWSFLISKNRFDPDRPSSRRKEAELPAFVEQSGTERSAAAPQAAGRVAEVAPLSVMGIGSWPRPPWLLRALHDRLEGRLPEAEFEALADRAVAEVVQAQIDAGVDVVTDGEQRRDSYASFIGARLENCQLIPVVDLLAYVEHPDEFARELRALDVPAESVRHPAVFGRLRRDPRRPLAVHELQAVRRITDRPVKVALPGPYLLTRTMWLECVSDRAYETRESLAEDIVRVLREEIEALLAAGAAIVQLDEPVLTEVVHGRPSGSAQRSFMCGASASGRRGARAGPVARRVRSTVCRASGSPSMSAAGTGPATNPPPWPATTPPWSRCSRRCPSAPCSWSCAPPGPAT
ncbi:MAG: sulfurtransferase TusA family protein [Isosphaeraceae bacterium]